MVPVPAGANQRNSMLYSLLSPFYLPYFLERRLTQLRPAESSRASEENDAEEMSLTDLDVAVIRHGIGVARANGDEPRVLISLPGRAADEAERLCEDEGVITVRLDLAAMGEAAILGPHDHHWTPAAHAAIAAQIESGWAQIHAVTYD